MYMVFLWLELSFSRYYGLWFWWEIAIEMCRDFLLWNMHVADVCVRLTALMTIKEPHCKRNAEIWEQIGKANAFCVCILNFRERWNESDSYLPFLFFDFYFPSFPRSHTSVRLLVRVLYSKLRQNNAETWSYRQYELAVCSMCTQRGWLALSFAGIFFVRMCVCVAWIAVAMKI